MGFIVNSKGVATKAFDGMKRAFSGKATAAAISTGTTSGRSSGAMAGMGAGIKNAAKDPMAFAKKHKVGIGVGTGAAMGGVAISRTRKSGLNKTPGRPTGMYKY